MIILMTVNADRSFHMSGGDTVSLVVDGRDGREVLIREEIVKARTIDYAATYCFADEDGRVLNYNICGIFAESHNLPKEIKEAKGLKDLTQEQLWNFAETSPIRVTIS